MFINALRAELIKQRRSPVWLAFLFLPIIPAVMGTFNYMGNLDLLQSGWYSLWTQHTLFTCYFFLPVLIGIFCAWLCRLEHTTHGWNQLLSGKMPFACIYFAKLTVASVTGALAMCWVGILFILSGLFAGLPGPPPAVLALWLICGALGSAVICAIQLFFSLITHSFALPVGAALLGGIGGLIALTQDAGIFFPYALPSIGMRASAPQEPMVYPLSAFLLSAAAFAVFFSGLSLHYMRRKDL